MLERRSQTCLSEPYVLMRNQLLSCKAIAGAIVYEADGFAEGTVSQGLDGGG